MVPGKIKGKPRFIFTIWADFCRSWSLLALTLLVLLELVAEYFYLELGWLQGIVFLFHQSVVDSLHVLAASPAAILSLNRGDVFLSIQYYLAKARSCRMQSLIKPFQPC